MIGNIGGGGGFGGLLGYVLDREKQPRILSENMASDTPSDLAREFRRISLGSAFSPLILQSLRSLKISQETFCSPNISFAFSTRWWKVSTV